MGLRTQQLSLPFFLIALRHRHRPCSLPSYDRLQSGFGDHCSTATDASKTWHKAHGGASCSCSARRIGETYRDPIMWLKAQEKHTGRDRSRKCNPIRSETRLYDYDHLSTPPSTIRPPHSIHDHFSSGFSSLLYAGLWTRRLDLDGRATYLKVDRNLNLSTRLT
ncbi:hypothetical protein BT96DRAFT_180233 [Gymnopus androsaceus JB14]|uniref:Uncharacterized protein n=1 Tax=Gymnopus androsaceus JB14 TaxID=1447944 RepID=A0A6A4HAB0_9AGAR|nr:hypothetical protein BT96DRAFT_180233 [Gymnopus androsaceus JB14]